MELIDNTPLFFYFTRQNGIDDFVDREGKEGELFSRIMASCKRNGRSLNDIIDDVNMAYRNCIEIFLRTHPELTYDCGFLDPHCQPMPNEKSIYEQAITYVLLKCQPKAKKNDKIERLIDTFERTLWANNYDVGEFDQDIMSIFNNSYFAEIDIDFSPNPNREAVIQHLNRNSDFNLMTNEYNYKKIEFLINLMRTKEDKLMLLDAIDNAHKDYILASFGPTADLPF